MAIDPTVSDLMQDTITVYAQASLDKYGKRTFAGTSTSIKCRLINGIRLTRDRQGRETIEAGRAICYGPQLSVTVDHKIVLPDGQTPPILSVSHIKDETGLDHHTVITFGV